MKKRFLYLVLAALVVCSSAHAAVTVYDDGDRLGVFEEIDITGGAAVTKSGRKVTINTSGTNLVTTGTANGGATSMTTTDTAVSVAYSYVRKNIHPDVGQVGTLANGVAGQLITIHATEDQGGSFVLTPTTKTGFTTATFADVGDILTLMYVNNTVGWIVVSNSGVTLG